MPLGWHISVYRQANDGTLPASFKSVLGARLAVWQTGLFGLEWLRELVKQQKAIDLDGGGYPSGFTAQAVHIIPRIREDPPEAKTFWSFDEGDQILPELWPGKTTKDLEAMNSCRDDEWLFIQAWDES